MRTIIVHVITVFHIRWIYYYKSFGKIDIYNTDAKGRKTKEFHLLWHRCLSHIGNETWKNSILMDFRVIWFWIDWRLWDFS
jgi:hypothetical protein